MHPALARRGRKKRRRGGFRARARRAGGRIRRAARRFRTRKPQLGLLGKSGVLLAGGLPVGWGAMEALKPWVDPGYSNVPIDGKLKHSAARFVNSLTKGFGLGDTFTGIIGGHSVETTDNPGGSWIKTGTVGLTLVVTDFIQGALFKVTGKSVPRTKFMGKQLLTG